MSTQGHLGSGISANCIWAGYEFGDHAFPPLIQSAEHYTLAGYTYSLSRCRIVLGLCDSIFSDYGDVTTTYNRDFL